MGRGKIGVFIALRHPLKLSCLLFVAEFVCCVMQRPYRAMANVGLARVRGILLSVNSAGEWCRSRPLRFVFVSSAFLRWMLMATRRSRQNETSKKHVFLESTSVPPAAMCAWCVELFHVHVLTSWFSETLFGGWIASCIPHQHAPLFAICMVHSAVSNHIA